MPTFDEYLPLIQAGAGFRPADLARAIREDRALQDWHRKTLLVQLGITVDQAARQAGAARSDAGLEVKDVA
jgi:hypothetical protein